MHESHLTTVSHLTMAGQGSERGDETGGAHSCACEDSLLSKHCCVCGMSLRWDDDTAIHSPHPKVELTPELPNLSLPDDVTSEIL